MLTLLNCFEPFLFKG
uniref:Uncharacterized protein n=1 Tax=Anguilla anguilla TaxID=7936 RepID=A0A0E9UC86_ANGAN